ncbi:MAG: hypothetical protein C0507_23150 [Cyanobacteria bacterium PR.3.49]|nr:hypothetical protein [Cyanobacteria bacterium PR.3.49]
MKIRPAQNSNSNAAHKDVATPALLPCVVTSALLPCIVTVVLGVTAVSASSKTQEKILEFPSDTSYGNLSRVIHVNPLETHAERSPLGQARGKIKVPADAIIFFEPGPRFFQRPEILNKLPPDSIAYIRMQFTAMDDNEMQMSDRAVKYLRHLTGLLAVDFDRSDTSDVGAAELAGLPNLQAVSLTGSTVNGTCLKSLSSCPKLQMLRFGSGQVKDEALRSLSNYKSLKRLVLNRCNLTDASAQNIAKGKSIVLLDVSNNPKISDTGLKYLGQLKLDYINLRETGVSIEGVREFVKNRQCRVVMPRMFSEYSKAQLDEIKKIRGGDIVFDHDHNIKYTDLKTIFGTVDRSRKK